MKKILLFFVLLFSIIASSVAQDTEFWFIPPLDSNGQGYNINAGFVFSNSTNFPANVRIHFFKTGLDIDFTILPNDGAHIILTDAYINANLTQPRSTAGRTGFSGGVKITSSQPIIAYYLFDTGANKDIFTLKGKNALGTDFYVPQSSDGFFLNGYNKSTGVLGYQFSRDMIDIIATENNTVVTFEIPRKCFSNGYTAPASFYAPNVTQSVTLQQGQVFKLMEVDKLDPNTATQPTLGVLNTLAGTHIYASKPIAVTSGEDLANHDMMGDQMVPTEHLGTLYVVLKGYSSGNTTVSSDRIYITATESNTDVEINTGGSWLTLKTGMNPGDMAAYDMGNITSGAPYAVTVRSTKPVACLHSTAEYIHPASGIVPTLYSLGQSDFSFYQLGDKNLVHNAMMLVYQAGCDTNFHISYTDNVTSLPISVPLIDPATGTINTALIGASLNGRSTVPGISGWEYMRITLSNRADQGLVRLSNSKSPFSFGYYSGCNVNSNPNYNLYNTYGYISTFGAFNFNPDTTWRCASSRQPVTLMGGYAEYYKWILPDGTIKEGSNLVSIKANDAGRYILKMNQGQGTNESLWTVDTCWIEDVAFNASINRKPAAPKPPKVGIPQLFSADTKGVTITGLNYKWTFEGASPATSVSPSPTVVWNSTGQKRVTLNLSVSRGVGENEIICDTTIVMDLLVISQNNGYFVDQNVSGGLHNGSNWQNAFLTVQEALELAYHGDYVWVAKGEYSPVADDTYLINYDSVSIYGGFGAWETNLNERDFAANPTILNGRNNSVVTFDGSTGYSNGLCGISTGAVLDGFIIQNGKATDGAGILFTNGASGTVSNCIIRNNYATQNGGGIHLVNPSCGHKSPVFFNLEVSGNTAGAGAGIYNSGSDFTATNITVSGNKATSIGGLYNNGGNPGICNSIIWGNRDNSGTDGTMDITAATGTPAYTYSIIGGSKGSGSRWNVALGTDAGKNTDVSPLFRKSGFDNSGNMTQGNYQLTATSKAVNTGRNNFVQSNNRLLRDINLLTPVDTVYINHIPNDLNGGNRIEYDIVDRGAYEYYKDNSWQEIVHQIFIPVVDNVTTDPETGLYWIGGHDSYVLTLYPKEGYSLKDIKITTGSKRQDEDGGMLVVYNEDGSVTVTFREVTEPIDVQITGISPVSNDIIDSSYAIWTDNNRLHIRTTKAGILKVYTLTGAMLKQQELTEGEISFPLSQGIYIVTFNDGSQQKVVVK
ncbi:MAG: hypothetical protein LBV72_16175 [Tannerella sp.]|jgi:hypothetical protein|nr:hypothetical protein [Tannerella sp.]